MNISLQYLNTPILSYVKEYGAIFKREKSIQMQDLPVFGFFLHYAVSTENNRKSNSVNEVLESSVKTALYSIPIQINTNVIIFRSVLPFLHIVMGKQTNKKVTSMKRVFEKR